MKGWVKETLLAVVLLMLPIILLCWNSSPTDEFVDINVHDVYFVVHPAMAVSAVFMILYFPLYLVRAIISRFSNSFVNIVLMVFTIAMTYILWYIIEILELIYSAGTITYPPLSGPPQEIPEREPPVKYIYLYIFQVLLVLLFAFTLYRTIKKHNNHDKITLAMLFVIWIHRMQ